MTLTTISTTTIGAGPLYTFGANGDQLVILSGVTLGSTSGSALSGLSFDDIQLTILGTLSSASILTFGGIESIISIGAGGTFFSAEPTAGNAGIFLSSSGNIGNTLINDGSLIAPSTIGVLSEGGGSIINNGSISAASGVFIGLFGADGDSLINTGNISANANDDSNRNIRYNNGVYTEGGNTFISNGAGGEISAISSEGAGVRFGQAAGGSRLFNAGTITSALDFGVSLASVNALEAQITVFNSGTISGGDGAYIGSDNDDQLVNRGLMVGDVMMGAGNDRLDARWGSIEGNVDLGAGNDLYIGRFAQIDGTVLGGFGDDTMRGNANLDEILNGGDGVDTLNFLPDARVVVALDGSVDGDGAALGDIYSNFERVVGTAGGNDFIRGNGADNELYGLGGNDTLQGMDGNDMLLGGNGNDRLFGGAGIDQMVGQGGVDTLTGGAGNDNFRYTALDQIGDVITDFHNLAGDNDRFIITASAFGGGLIAGALAASQFITRADNLAQDADDLFIFRTTDRTLWFDDDGIGGSAAVMVADLQAGATMTAADIFLI